MNKKAMGERKMNKKAMIMALMVVISSMSIFIFPVVAQGTSVSIESASADAGTTTVVSIVAHNVTDLGSFGLQLEYNPNVVIAMSAENNPQLPDTWEISDFSQNATGFVGLASSGMTLPSLSGDEVVLTNVTLKAVGNVDQTSPLNITIGNLFKSDGTTKIDATDVDGTFTVTGIPTGVYVSIESVNAPQDRTVVSSIVAHNVTDLGSFGLQLEYNPNVVIAMSAENNPQLPDTWEISDFSQNATGFVGLASSGMTLPSLSGDEVVLTNVTLKAVGNVDQTSPLNITIGNLFKSDGTTKIDATDVDGIFRVIAPGPTLTWQDEPPVSVTQGEDVTFDVSFSESADYYFRIENSTGGVVWRYPTTGTYSAMNPTAKTWTTTTDTPTGDYTIIININDVDNPDTRTVTVEELVEQVPVSNAKGGYDPDIALSSAGTIYVAFRGYASEYGGIDFAKSTDGGAVFSPQITAGDAASAKYAAIAADGETNVYVVWKYDYNIYYARSANGGDSFEDAVQVSDAGVNDADNPDIAVDSNGTIYVVWECGWRSDVYQIRIDKLTDGTSFGTDVNVTAGSAVAGNPSIAIDSDDNILVAWDGSSTDHVSFANSTDGGAAFSTPVQVDDSDTGAVYPSIAVDPTDSSKVYVAWQDRRNVYADIYAATSDNGGASFGDDVKVNDDDTDTNSHQKFPCMAVNSTGAVFVVWQDGRNYESSDYDVYFAGSTDAGSTFSANRKVNPNDTKAVAPTLTVDNTNAFVAWENTDTDDGKIYFRKGSLSEWTAVEEQPDLIVTEIEPKCGELFANESNNITATVKNNGSADADAFNVSFAAADDFSDKVSVSGLAAGATTTVYAIDNTTRNAGATVTITVTADCDDMISESNEGNNVNTTESLTVYNNGYKGKSFMGVDSLELFEHDEEMYGGITYNVSGTKDWKFEPGENQTRMHHIDIPAGMEVKKARLYMYWYDYFYNTPPGCLANLSVNFSGTTFIVPDAAYTDQKGFGNWNTPKGAYMYNVTSQVTGTGNYRVIIENIDPTNKTAILGEMLFVVYEDPSQESGNRTQLWMLEGNDLLMAADDTHGGYNYGVSPEEATATVVFPGSIDVANVRSATLVSVVTQGMDPGSNMLFNDEVIKTDAWDSPTEAYSDSKINVESVNVTATLTASGNNMGFRDTGTSGMQASNAILMVEVTARVSGDVNGDTEVNIQDAVLLFNWVSFPAERGTTYVLEKPENANVNGDMEINIQDAVLLFNWVSFPAERGTTYILQ